MKLVTKVWPALVAVSLCACPAPEPAEQAPAAEVAKKEPEPAPAPPPAPVVPAEVGHIQNPAFKDVPTPTDMPPFDGKAAQAVVDGVATERAGAMAAACKASPAQVVRLVPDGTRVGYQAYKNGNLPVPGMFAKASGYAVFGAQPQFNVWIDPLSLNSGDPVRDRKLLKLFFELETAANGAFTFSGDRIEGSLPEGDGQSDVTLSGNLQMHQKSVPLSLTFAVTRKGQALTAELEEPVRLLQLADFGLVEPLKALITSCNHKSMGDAVNLQVTLALAMGCEG